MISKSWNETYCELKEQGKENIL